MSPTQSPRNEEIKDMETLKIALVDYNRLYIQSIEHARLGKPVTKKLTALKKSLLKHMTEEKLNKIQLPNKDLLVINETTKRPTLNDKYLRTRLDSYFENNQSAADTLFSFLHAVPEADMQIRTTLKHIELDSYIENESE